MRVRTLSRNENRRQSSTWSSLTGLAREGGQARCGQSGGYQGGQGGYQQQSGGKEIFHLLGLSDMS